MHIFILLSPLQHMQCVLNSTLTLLLGSVPLAMEQDTIILAYEFLCLPDNQLGKLLPLVHGGERYKNVGRPFRKVFAPRAVARRSGSVEGWCLLESAVLEVVPGKGLF